MKKLITILALVLLFTASAQAILMDQNWDDYPADDSANLETFAGWNDITPSGNAYIRLTWAGANPATWRRIEWKNSGAGMTRYEYEVDDSVVLGAGEYYRYESEWRVPDIGAFPSASIVTRLRHSDGRQIQFYFDPGSAAVTWQDGAIDLSLYDARWDLGGSSLVNMASFIPADGDNLSLRIEAGPDGVRAWYKPGSYPVPATAWIPLGEALATTNPLFGFAGGLEAVEVEMYAGSGASTPTADTFTLQVLPEPATLAVLAFGGLAALLRRKR